MSDEQSIVLYPFRKRDPLTGKWYRARWKASLDDIEARGGVVDGPPETYRSLGATSNFRVDRRPAPRDDPPQMHPQREQPPAIDQLECYLARAFLRRYATYCVRRKRYAQAQGAAALGRELLSLGRR
jgi:hypothetical protein